MEFCAESPMKLLTQRYSSSSDSSEFSTADITFHQLSSGTESKSCKAEDSEHKELHRRNRVDSFLPRTVEPFYSSLERTPLRNMTPTSANCCISDSTPKSPVKNRDFCQSLDDLPFSAHLSSEQVNLSTSAAIWTEGNDIRDKCLTEFTHHDTGAMYCDSPNFSSPSLLSSSDFGCLTKAMHNLKAFGQDDKLEFSAGIVGSRNRFGARSPALASSDDVIFAVPMAKQVSLSEDEKNSAGIGQLCRKREKNLVNCTIKAEIKAKILGNKYALLDDEDPQRDEIIQNQLEGFYRKVIEGNTSQVPLTSFNH